MSNCDDTSRDALGWKSGGSECESNTKGFFTFSKLVILKAIRMREVREVWDC